jgi:hypothetical protein
MRREVGDLIIVSVPHHPWGVLTLDLRIIALLTVFYGSSYGISEDEYSIIYSFFTTNGDLSWTSGISSLETWYSSSHRLVESLSRENHNIHVSDGIQEQNEISIP